MKRLLIATVLILFSSQIWASEPIEVKISTEMHLIPIYVGRIQSEDNHLEALFTGQLESVLRFDLSHNGSTALIPVTSERESYLKSRSNAPWNRLGIYYLVRGRVANGQLHIEATDVSNGNEMRFDPITLTGKLEEDRKKIHTLSDSIHRAFFGVDGIATTKILYAEKKAKGTYPPLSNEMTGEIFVMDYDGENNQKATNENALCVTPSFLPPSPGKISKDFFYVCYKNGQPKIFHSSLNRLDRERVTSLRGNQLMPEMNKQRNKLVFVSDAGGNPDLFLATFDPNQGVVGKPRQIYAVPYATQATPTFDPTGEKVAFVSNKDGVARIYVMEVPREGQTIKDINPTLLIKNKKACTAPNWSPDGTKIAYTAKRDGTRQIWMYDFSTNTNKQLTMGPGDKENPSWAPNSLHLAYNVSKGNSCNIYMLNINQLQPIQLTKGTEEKKYPSWEKR